jgi:micrococcal nuclease
MRGVSALMTAVCLALVVACADTVHAPEGSPGPSATTTAGRITPQPTGSPSATPLVEIDIPYPTDLETATVTRVVDGDTIEVDIAGETHKVRYIGVDTPETVDPNRPVGCYGHEASDRNKELVLGKIVGLEKDVSNTDDFGRLLRYVWVDGQMVNALLVRDGYAEAETGFAEVKHQDVFLELQAEAQAAGRGIWGPECSNATPFDSPTQTPPAGSGTEICQFSGTTQAVIKGNISSSDEKIYHVPGQSSYDETGITESRGERWFCTEQEAVNAGWRKSKS